MVFRGKYKDVANVSKSGKQISCGFLPKLLQTHNPPMSILIDGKYDTFI